MRCVISGEELEPPEITARLCETLSLPLPQVSYEESLRRKLGFRNYLNLFRRKCDKTGKAIISNFPPDSPFTVYDKDVWWGDSWDPLSYGRDFDFEAGFFPQFYQLQRDVPIFSLQNMKSENADYCNSVENIKRCYLAFVTYYGSEDIYYAVEAFYSRDIYYSLYTLKGELNFYCFKTNSCYNNIGLEECLQCADCAFSFFLENCRHCLFCSNLRNREYCIGNQSVSPSQYTAFIKELKLDTATGLAAAFERFERVKKEAVYREAVLVNCEDCTGNHLAEAKNCQAAFEGMQAEDVAETMSFSRVRNGARLYGIGAESDTVYECTGCLGLQRCSFVMLGYYSFDCHYCINIHNCSDCFGCVGLRRAQYCIFNRQYSKSDYLKLREKIIEHMKIWPLDDPSCAVEVTEYGHFFPLRNSYIPIDCSMAQVFLPLSSAEARRRGYWLSTDLARQSIGSAEKELPADCPDSIDDWNESMAKRGLRCVQTGRAFNVAIQVIRKFQQHRIAILPEHPLNYLTRKLGTVPCRLLERTSSKSGKPILTAYSEECAPRIYANDEYRDDYYA